MARHSRPVEATLQKFGYRLTPQRMMVLEAVRSGDDHISADEIYQAVRRRYPHINISTVYRTLELLRELGLVTETDLGGGSVCYHWAEKGHHHHLVCQRCGAVASLEDSVLDSLQETLQERYGFRANLAHLAIFGECGRCRGEQIRAGKGEL